MPSMSSERKESKKFRAHAGRLPLKDACPQLRLLRFNGKAAGRYAPVYADAGYEVLVLPSSSPANAQLSFAAKLALWHAIDR